MPANCYRMGCPMKDRFVRAWAWWMERNRAILPALFADAAPLDLRFVGRTLLQAAAVGIVCGFAGAAFFGALEYTQRLLLEDLAGYELLRASGETFAARTRPARLPPLAAAAAAGAGRPGLRLAHPARRPRPAAAAAT